MTQGELEKIPQKVIDSISTLEMRIMTDIVRRVEENGFLSASDRWQISRLQQLSESDDQIREWIQDFLQVADEAMEEIISEDVYQEYYSHAPAYNLSRTKQIPFSENQALQQTIEAVKRQTQETFENLTGSMGFAKKNPATGKLEYSELGEFYRNTLDQAMYDIHSGAYDYNTVLNRTIKQMTDSGIRWVDYESGHRDRVDVAVRRAVMTGFRQIQGQINDQVAEELHTDYFEVTVHVGARPTHQPWQGRVYSRQELIDVCGLGDVTGLKGINCYHDYRAFIPGISTRTYTDEQLEEMIRKENTPKEYNGKQYTTYEALQQQRAMERAMRKTRQDIQLLKEGGASDQEIMLRKAKYQGQYQTYKDFSEKMDLPTQMERVYQDGLTGNFNLTKKETKALEEMKSGNTVSWNENAPKKATEGDYGVNWPKVSSSEYREKISSLSDNSKVVDSIETRAKWALSNRDGLKTEEIYAVSLKDGKEIARITDQNTESGVTRTASFTQKLNLAEKDGDQVLLIHNHPQSSPPSVSDFNILLSNKNLSGITVGHDGSLYYYTRPNKPIPEFDFAVAIRKYKRYTYNTSVEKAYEEFAAEYGITLKKL